MTGIFAIVCPACGAPFEDQPDAAPPVTDATVAASNRHRAADAADVADDADVHVCGGCACAFVVRFGYAFAVPHPTDRGAA